MTVKGFIKKMLTSACVYFSIVMLCYIIIAAVVNVSDDALLLEAGRTVLFFVFSLLVALANTVFSVKALSAKIRVLIHYFICAFAFYSCFMLSVSMRASGVLIGLVLFSVLYFAILGIGAAFKAKYRANTERAENYEKQYANKN